MRILLLLSFLSFPFLLFAQYNGEPKELSIDSAAFATLKLPGYPDFLEPDGDDVWILNIDRVEKLSAKRKKPILSAPIPGLWSHDCRFEFFVGSQLQQKSNL